MKPLTPTPYELGREAADKQEAALVKQAIADRTADKQRIHELAALLSEAHEMIHTLSDAWSDTQEADNMRRRIRAILKGAK